MASKTVVCAICGSRGGKRLPSTWTQNDCLNYCRDCWATVACVGCGHHDPKGRDWDGRWTCRACRHRCCSKVREATAAVEEFHREIIKDQNGEEGCWQADHWPPLGGTAAPSLEDEGNDKADESDEGDIVPPLPRPLALAVPRKADMCEPWHVILVLDGSGSMRTEDVACDQLGDGIDAIEVGAVTSRANAVVKCTSRFVASHARVRPRDVFSIVTFNEKAEVVGQLLDGRDAQEIIRAMPFRGMNGTLYSPALSEAAKLLASGPLPIGHVLLFSDGRPADPKACLESFQQSFTSGELATSYVHGIGFGAAAGNFAVLQQLSCLGGGTFALAGCSMRSLSDAFASITSTITSMSSGSAILVSDPRAGRVSRGARQIDFEVADQPVFGKKGVLRIKARRSSFRYGGGGGEGGRFEEQCWPASDVCRRAKPNMRGGMRLVYSFQDTQVVPDDGSWMVAKSSRFVNELLNSRKVVEAHAKSTAVARYYAALFNQLVKKIGGSPQSPGIFFVACYVYEVEGACPEGEPRAFTGERYLPGAFLKYNSNHGYVCDPLLQHNEVVQAFMHFTFAHSSRELLVADLQGVARQGEVLLTDPQVLSQAQEFGPGDIGSIGMRACLVSHRCGPTCRQLGLKPIGATDLRRLGKDGAAGARHTLVGPSSAASSAGWEKISSGSRSSSDWQHLKDSSCANFLLSDGHSSQASASSWVQLLDS